MLRSYRLPLVGIVLLVFSLAPFAAARAATDILFGGASVVGVYYQAALQICNLVNRHGEGKYNCVGRPSLGSVFNINAVDRGLLDFGVAQSDRNWQAFNGHADWEGSPVETLRSVVSLHPETVMLVARADSGIESVEDLRGKRVNIGNPGSGQRANAEDVLRLYEIDPSRDFRAQGLQQQEASRALVDRSIDAFFYTVGNPSAAIEQPAQSASLRFIPLDAPAIQEFVSERPYYVMTEIPANTYRGQGEAVPTYAVTATVVTRDDVPEEVVYDVVRVVFERLDDLRASHAAFRNLEPEQMLQGLSAPLHPGAERYYREQGWM
jgi:uncharacterized protein